MSTPPACRVVGSANAGVHLVDHLKLSIGNDGIAALALVGLVIDRNQSLATKAVHIGNGLEGKFGSGYILGHSLLKLDSSGNIGESLGQFCALEHLLGHTVQSHRQRQFVLSRGAAADGLDVGSEEVDVGTLGHQEGADGRVRRISIQVRQRGRLCVFLHDCSVRNLHDESAIRAVDGQHNASAELVNTRVGIGLEGEGAHYERAVDVVTPLGVTAGLVVVADSTIFLIVGSTTILIVGEDECEVLIGVRSSGIDVQIEQSVPNSTFINLVVLGELSPPASTEVGSTDGVDVFHHAFQFLVVATFVGIDRVDYLLEPVGGIDVVKVATLAAGHRKHSQCSDAEGHCYFSHIFHNYQLLIINYKLLHHRMYGPALLGEVACVVAVVIGRISCQIGIVVECTLIDGQILVALHISVVRALAA